jgi:hypothetical protein
MEAIAILRRADSFTIFGLFLSVNLMTTVLVSSHLNSVSDTEAWIMLSVLLISTDHFTHTTYTLHTYFGLINEETTLSFGSKICSSRDEEVRSGWLMKICLTTPFTLSCIKTRSIGKEVGKPVGWEPPTLSGCITCPSPGRHARLYGDFPYIDIINSIKLTRLVQATSNQRLALFAVSRIEYIHILSPLSLTCTWGIVSRSVQTNSTSQEVGQRQELLHCPRNCQT